MEVTNPHDKFFKESFSDKMFALDFIQGAFPKDLLEKLDLNSLELDNNSYIDEELKEFFSDIVYNCNYAESKVKVALLFEHKSYLPDYPFLQLLKYMIKIWDTDIKQKEKLTPVIPVIFYHGTEKWEYKKIFEYFENIDSILHNFIPDFNYILTDLSNYSNEQLKNELFHNELLKVSLLIMKNIFDEKKLKKNLEDFIKLGKFYYEEERGLRFLESLIRYIYNNVENIGADEVIDTVKKISTVGGEQSMTVAMKLREEGKIEGKIEGEIKVAVKMIKQGYSIENVLECTDLKKSEVQSLLEKYRVSKS